MYPRIPLEQALIYSKKLVSKTAVAPQSEATLLAGVFGNASSEGKVRLSALKQFGLVEGDSKAHFASRLAKDIDAAADEAESLPLVRKAFLSARVFQELFNTYQDDQASKAKIKGRAQQLRVHPDLADGCADLFISSAVAAKLASIEGDGVRLLPTTQIGQPAPAPAEQKDNSIAEAEATADHDPKLPSAVAEGAPLSSASSDQQGSDPTAFAPRPRTAADVAINLTVDSSLDGDKLERHLALLRRYGLI
ncbi:MAG: hypothetical protein P4K93_13570 [Terracidiphilus sp.]|nr:hypothetical protein [Terracidiphilus sp.]